ncbi:MAG: PKD domain-containing protein, partial [Bacteroidia bacterium]|nr:PKD domain-containing protein [Bacteroidia bacterium]
VDAAYTSADSSCSAPFTVTFNNTSNNASTFIWDFGDGTTSSAASPMHTYNNYGSYTVSLIADGGACGVDTVTVVDQVVIDSSFACVAFTGDGTQTSCFGTLYDSGGPNNDYPDNQDFITTISPVNAANVTLTFTLFDVENASGCIYDYIEIFDGPTTASPSLGQYCGSVIPGPFTSSGPSITVLQHSDQAVVGEGFVADWACYKANQPPTVDFTSDVTETCTGEVQFTDLTIGNPVSWDWDFGDGNSSTMKDPFHTYASGGFYTVTLIAVNSFGSDTVVKTALINVTKPSAPGASGDDNCGPASLVLSATPSSPGNTISWFDQVVGGTLLDTGTTFVTPVINTTTTYYAEEAVQAPAQSVGPLDNTIGSGGYYNFNTFIVFDAFVPFTLVSTQVYAGTAGNRLITLRTSSGAFIADTLVNLPAGPSRVTLDFDVPIGIDMELGIFTGTANLYRNNGGVNYPYTIPGIVSIHNSNAGQNYYYFFYDWEIRETDCLSDRTAVVAEIFPEPAATYTTVKQACFGNFSGEIDLTVTGGTAPYLYLWSNGATVQDQVGLSTGTYSVSISDANDCNASESIFVGIQPPLSITTGKSNVTCNGADNGTARAVVSGGTAGYTYNWDTSPVSSSDQVNNLPGGSYTVTVNDTRGCTKTSVVNIFDPSAIGAFSIPNNPNNGDINLLVTGGIAPYSYNWNTGSTNEDLTGAQAGVFYFCQITDRNSCARIHALVMPNPQQSPPIIDKGEQLRKVLKDDVDIFPNPANENVAVVFATDKDESYQILLRDISGKLLSSFNNQSKFGDVSHIIDLSALSKGMYFVEVYRSGQKTVKKLVKK